MSTRRTTAANSWRSRLRSYRRMFRTTRSGKATSPADPVSVRSAEYVGMDAATPIELHAGRPDQKICDRRLPDLSRRRQEAKMLKRHLMTAYGMTPQDYRAKWGLKLDYPMVAPNYAQKRQELRRRLAWAASRASARRHLSPRPSALAQSQRLPEPRGWPWRKIGSAVPCSTSSPELRVPEGRPPRGERACKMVQVISFFPAAAHNLLLHCANALGR